MKQRKLALSMRGGGAKCLAYLGLLKLLEEENIKVDYILGSSGGAIVGAGYAAGISIEKILEHSIKLQVKKMASVHSILKWDVADQNKIGAYIRILLGNIKAEDTNIPFWGQVTDMEAGCPVLLDKGDLTTILQASMAFPFLADPIVINGKLYGDGDLTGGYETKFLKSQGAEVVIGLKNPIRQWDHHNPLSLSISEPLLVMRKTMINLYNQVDPPDLLIDRFAKDIGGTLDFSKGREFFEQGYELSKGYLPQIKELVFRNKTFYFFKKLIGQVK